ncbi:MAG: sigma 54-interacting transcriptional regulator [Candidatus Electryonea clarkiae]|nr:sigma 54-interacting transcriptional regulator [Candidatus Electryonea clarkiae]MDP8285266.1 sigma 54-interacting transcriptional regulator [Candidatus Electryonea clarkiae]
MISKSQFMNGKDHHFFKVILGSIAEGVFTVDKDRRITSFNAAAEKITGVSESDAIGKKCNEVFHSDICETACQLNKTMMTGQEAVDIPVNIVNHAGTSVPISVSTAVLHDDNGKILGAVETFRDLTAIERLRKKLYSNYTFQDIVTKSPSLLKIIDILPDMAESGSTVLIQGPSGSGKELFARAVYNLSHRNKKPYVIINCGTLPPQLFESELFGYLKGAFTDAKKDKPGKIVSAEGGTLFLDEVGELPFQTQVKLLRLLQQREYEPLGSEKTLKADIRVVAATNQNLREMVHTGKFREDLYYRLAVIRIDLPPLNDRREDIPILVDHFIRYFNARFGKNILNVSPGVMEILMRYDFSGNVRELENTIEYGFAVCHGRTIEISHLPREISENTYLPSMTDSVLENHHLTKNSTSTNPRKYISSEQIMNALNHHEGNRSKAAAELGIDRTTLWRKMKNFGIDS